jgi:two-component system phosphate regulon sensor histidine kinase PhoR
VGRKRLIPSFALSCALIIGLSLLMALRFGEKHMGEVAFSQKAADLEAIARVAGRQFADLNAGSPSPRLDADNVDSLCKELGKAISVRFTVVRSGGEVAGDSLKDPEVMENHGNRPEIKEAFAGRPGMAVRMSATLGLKMMYVAVPADGEGGVVRVSVPLAEIESALRTMRFRIVLTGIVFVALGGGLTLMVFRRVVKPLGDLRQGAERLAAGDLGSRVPVPETEELGRCADAMNRMAAQLDERLKTEVERRNEIEAVLTSMLEGVIATDTEKNIISMNRAAALFLGVDAGDVKGRSIFEVVRNTALLDFVGDTLAAEESRESEIVLRGEGEKSLQLHGTMLRDVQERVIGALVVLNDVTRIRQLESVRRDFVLNASHEIRTPVTSIKGFVETLLDGALDDRENVERFLGIIGRHADRLNAIVEDLLNLSRIEQEAESGEISMGKESLGQVVEEALDVCGPGSQEKGVTLAQECGGGMTVRMNASLLVQAVINLVDNAVKYSEPGSTVTVSCGRDESWATIKVVDEGCGIAEEHLPRLFERFYRVDKARSRSLGGTGLGLAIVKHIVQSHRGSLIVESEQGRGSTFTIFLPGDA